MDNAIALPLICSFAFNSIVSVEQVARVWKDKDVGQKLSVGASL